MGVLVVLEAIGAAGEATARVAAVLNKARSVILQINNRTSGPLRLLSHHHDHGGFAEPPDQEIPPGKAEIFGSQSKAWSIGTGTEGNVVYSGDGFELTVYWDNPFVAKPGGGNTARASLKGPKASAYKATAIAGAGDEKAQMKNEVFPPPVAPADFSDGVMMREVSAPAVYVIFGGAKFWLSSDEWVRRYGGWDAVKVVADGALANVPAVPREGALLKEWSGDRVYLMRGGTKCWIPSPERFAELGLDWNAIYLVPDGELTAIPDGADV
jgi:hypothetical protein